MHRFWHTIIRPILEVYRPKVLAEIGCGDGINTCNLVQFCRETSAVLHAIDPSPTFEAQAWQDRHAGYFIFHRAPSLDALAKLDAVDAALIDGDHNWYTAYQELMLLERRAIEAGRDFPLVFVHDVHWPYGRRDLYYSPERIPSEYRQPYERKGIRPDSSCLVPTGGFNADLCHASTQNTARNGVLTAVEDFLKLTQFDVRLVQIPGFHGLGVLVTRDPSQMAPLLANLESSPLLASHASRLEKERVSLLLSREEREISHKQETDALQERLHQLTSTVEAREADIKALSREVDGLRKRLVAVEESTSWRMTRPLRRAADLLRAVATRSRRWLRTCSLGELIAGETRKGRIAAGAVWRSIRLRRPREIAALIGVGLRLLFSGQAHLIRARLLSSVSEEVNPGAQSSPSGPVGGRRPMDPYRAWLEFNYWKGIDGQRLLNRLATVNKPLPRISIVMPVYNPRRDHFESAINSILGQVYTDWELCIGDDGSTDPQVRQALDDLASRDARIRVVSRRRNAGISAATNAAAEVATGEFLAFVDHDDELPPDALAEVALAIVERPQVDLLYTDHDVMDGNGDRVSPRFKPDWSPELLLSFMYCSHLLVARSSLYRDLQGMRSRFDGSQDYDFALRAAEHARQVAHIPRVLYHWRLSQGLTASTGHLKDRSLEAGRLAVEEALRRRGVAGTVSQTLWARQAGIGVYDHQFPDDGPRVTLVVPVASNSGQLLAFLNWVRQTTYRNLSVVMVPLHGVTLPPLDGFQMPIRVVSPDEPISGLAQALNLGAALADSPYLLFMVPELVGQDPQWLSRMMGYMQLRGVGAVGARLLSPDGRVFHAGYVQGYTDRVPRHAFQGCASTAPGYLYQSRVVRNCLGVSRFCMVTATELFKTLRGFDESKFPDHYTDVDYCNRLTDAGFRCVYCPGAEFTLDGLPAAPAKSVVDELANYRALYGGRLDSFLNPNLEIENAQLTITPACVPTSIPGPVRTLAFTHNLATTEGAPRSQLELLAALKERQVIDPTVWSPVDGPLREDYERHGIKVIVGSNPATGVRSEGGFSDGINGLIAQLKPLQVELVYANTLPTFYGISVARALGVPAIWNVRESEPWQTYYDYLQPLIAEEAYSNFSYPYRVVFVSEATRRHWSPLDTMHNFTVIPNGLNPRRLTTHLSSPEARHRLGISPEEVCILSLGTVCPRKGQEDLVEALAHLSESAAEGLRCLIVGARPGSYTDAIEARIRSLPPKLRARVVLVPETADVELYYRAADIFVCTSRVESYPRVTLEAMFFGLPVISTPVFGLSEQLQDGVNALFYEPGEALQLSEHLQTLFNHPKLRERMAANSRLVWKSLTSYEEMVTSYARVFRAAYLSRPPGGTQVAVTALADPSSDYRMTHERNNRPPGLRNQRLVLVPGPEVDYDASSGGYCSTGNDPQLMIKPIWGGLPNGWVELSLKISAEPGVRIRPLIYVDDGKGFSERTKVELRFVPGRDSKQLILLPRQVRALRFDPLTSPGRFAIETFDIRKVSKLGVLWRVLRPHFRSAFSDPRRGFSGIQTILQILRRGGVRQLKEHLLLSHRHSSMEYRFWTEQYDTLTKSDRALIADKIAWLPARPKISVVMPVYNPNTTHLRRAIESVKTQLYTNWELCIADDASVNPEVRRVLVEAERGDHRIRVLFRDQRGHIAHASNSALSLATGDFLALLDHDDELAEHALYRVVEELATHPEAVVIYTDDDKIDESGNRFSPQFKPDWNPDLMCTQNLISHLGVYRAEYVTRVGGFQPGLEGAQDYDLALRIVELVDPSLIRHIPEVLYHWRAVPGSVSHDPRHKRYAYEAARKALKLHLDRQGEAASVTEGHTFTIHRVHYHLPSPPPLVSLIIPTRDRVDLLRVCIESLIHKTRYPSFELLIVDHESEEPGTRAYLSQLRSGWPQNVRVLPYHGAFNFSRMMNRAAQQANGDILVFLNNDVEVINSEWLTEMVAHAIRPQIGAVGAKLYYPNDTIQHAGVVLNVHGLPTHAFKGFPREAPGYLGRLWRIQNYSAVTGACMALRRQVFAEVGGFDEKHLPVAYNDIDLCLRLGELGYRVLWTPYAELYHHESATLGPAQAPERMAQQRREEDYFRHRWKPLLQHDPAYNPNLTVGSTDFSLAFPPRVVKPWLTNDDHQPGQPDMRSVV